MLYYVKDLRFFCNLASARCIQRRFLYLLYRLFEFDDHIAIIFAIYNSIILYLSLLSFQKCEKNTTTLIQNPTTILHMGLITAQQP